jgi:mannose-6-phosphate isomerase-like protein (cupin superfamily)
MGEGRSTVQIENADVRVTRWDLGVGAATGPHRHAYDYVVVPLTTGRMGITAYDGTHSVTDLEPGTCYHRTAGVRHDVRNDGTDPLSFVEVEVLGRPEE